MMVFIKAILTINSGHRKFLDDAEPFLDKLKVKNRTGKLPPCITCWMENIIGLKLLYNESNKNYGIECLMTRRLIQDCNENVFSILIGKAW